MDVAFQYTCKANINNIDPYHLKLLRETGCQVVDYGRILVSHILKSDVFFRLQGACVETRKHNMVPSFVFSIDKNASYLSCREALKLLQSIDGLHKPIIHHPYGSAEDVETVIQMNKDLYNPTEWSWIELLGIQSAIEASNRQFKKFPTGWRP